MFRSLRMMRRLWHAAKTLAAYDVLPPPEWNDFTPAPLQWAKALGLFRKKKSLLQGRSGERLARAFTDLGPSYIKLGQFLATRPDVIGVEIARDLSELQDRLPPFPLAQARQILAEELSQDVRATIADMGDAIAAASIAQVHKVTLKAESEGAPPRVRALKILRPGIERAFAADLEAFAWAARKLEAFSAEAVRLRPVALVDTLARSIAIEMDLRLEGAAAVEMANNTAKDADFRVPAIDWNLTTRRVLATEWIDGISLKDQDALVAAGHDVKQLANIVIQSFLKHALRDGFFHADMHPGNLFVDSEGRLVAVDFGIMGRLDPLERRFMAETLGGFLARDYRSVAAIHLQVGFVSAEHKIDDFAQALRAIGEPIFGRDASQVSMAKLLAQLFEVTRLFDMPLQPQLVLLQKTMVVAEGVARQLDPTHSMWEASRPILEQWMVEQVGPQARLKDAAEGMTSLGRAISALPEVLRNAEQIAATLSAGGLKLHPDTARQIAEAQVSRTAHVRVAIWLGAAALALIALAQL
ncbi:MAG: 2-polyprenylphenol 6-hydroxylase [Alphaproteobacteria bacterium]|nr:2-polyprenylphenol 6-hydroxylase [Alphaproteobacteria bacterium]